MARECGALWHSLLDSGWAGGFLPRVRAVEGVLSQGSVERGPPVVLIIDCGGVLGGSWKPVGDRSLKWRLAIVGGITRMETGAEQGFMQGQLSSRCKIT